MSAQLAFTHLRRIEFRSFSCLLCSYQAPVQTIPAYSRHFVKLVMCPCVFHCHVNHRRAILVWVRDNYALRTCLQPNWRGAEQAQMEQWNGLLISLGWNKSSIGASESCHGKVYSVTGGNGMSVVKTACANGNNWIPFNNRQSFLAV